MGNPGRSDRHPEHKEPGFPVWPQNMVIVDAFLAITSQLRAIQIAPGQLLWQGFDYAGAKAGLEQSAMHLNPIQWTWLRVMERAAVSALNGYRG